MSTNPGITQLTGMLSCAHSTVITLVGWATAPFAAPYTDTLPSANAELIYPMWMILPAFCIRQQHDLSLEGDEAVQCRLP